jgi:hypothetical protein
VKNLVQTVNNWSTSYVFIVVLNGIAQSSNYFMLIVENQLGAADDTRGTLRAFLIVYFTCYFTSIGLASEAYFKVG